MGSDRRPRQQCRDTELRILRGPDARGHETRVRGELLRIRSDDSSRLTAYAASDVGRVGNPGLSGYASTKGAIESLTRSPRLELRHENVACTIMHPRLAKTRSATTLGYPESQMSDPEYVGRKLAGKIESTVIYTDRVTKIGLSLGQRVPRQEGHGAVLGRTRGDHRNAARASSHPSSVPMVTIDKMTSASHNYRPDDLRFCPPKMISNRSP